MRGIMMAISLGIIAASVVSLIFVAKITEIGGHKYDWEYFCPLMMLAFGIWRLLANSKRDGG